MKQESEGHRWNANSDLKTITNLANELKRVPVAGVATSVNIRGRPPNDLPPQEGTANPTKVGGWRRKTQRVRIRVTEESRKMEMGGGFGGNRREQEMLVQKEDENKR